MVSKSKQDNSKQFTYPGDTLATAEEYVPGRFTADDQGSIVSLTAGRIRRDDNNLVISVEPTKKRVRPRNGDVAYGQIIKMDGRHDTVRIGAICGSDGILKDFMGDANLRTMSQRGGRRGDSSPTFMLRIGDIVRGKITRSSPYLEVTINGKHYGSIKSLCSRCRQPLILKENSLYCDNCERTEARNFADDYGNVLEFGDVDERE